MLEYFEAGFKAAFLQMCLGVLSFLLLAYFLHLVGSRLKSVLMKLFGEGIKVVSIPGEFIRNSGVSLACLITGTRARRHILWDDTSRATRSIVHSRLKAGTPIGFIRNIVILTSPIWFGCVILVVFVLVAGGFGILPETNTVLSDQDVGLIDYAVAVFWAALAMIASFVCVWHWTSPFCLFCLLCFISIATEITIDARSLWSIKTGLFGLFILLIVLNAIPGVTVLFEMMGRALRPVLFPLHAILLFVVFFDFCASLLFQFFCAVVRCKG